MKKVIDFIKEHNYLMILLIFIGFSISLSLTYSNFIVTSNNHKAAEMYIGELKYSIEIDSESINTLTVPVGETIIDVKVNNLNPVDTYYKLLYLKNTNITIKYYESTKDTDDVVTTYNKPNDSITSSNSNNIKLLITNNSESSQNVALTMKGGYIINTLEDIITPSTYSEITLADTSTNTYFCTTNDTLTQGLQYTNGQYTYAYKQEGWYASSGLGWSNINNNGWGVQLTDKTGTDEVTNKVCTYINNKPITSMSYMFYDSKATSIDLSNFNTSNVTNMRFMFAYSQTTTLDVSNLNTSNVTNMSSMFFSSQATILDVSNFDTSKVTNMTQIFRNSKVTTLDLSNFDTSNATNMSTMFCDMTNLKTIYVSNKFNTNNVTNSSDMFTNSANLVGGAGTKYNSSYVDKTYARIDGGTSNPGYFTDIADKPSTFPTDDWATIVASVKAGNTRGYKVGETKTVDMGTYGTHTLRIANTSTPSECSTSGFSQTACGFVLEFADTLYQYNMNSSSTNVGGWPVSAMRTFVNKNIYNSLPTELQNAIIDTTVVSGHGSKSGETNFTSTDKLYLLSTAEIYTKETIDTLNNDSSSNTTRQLDYYKKKDVSNTNYSDAIKWQGTTGPLRWYLRSAYPSDMNSFHVISYKGNNTYMPAANNLGVSPAFRIG